MSALAFLKHRILSPPYPWLPASLFVFYVLCFAFHPASPILTHHLSDPDDYMRLNEVVSWLQGQNWYDLSVPRLSPGTHTIIHWSRLIDIPIAATALPFISAFGTTNAVAIASLLVPLMWFVLLLVLLPALARPYVGKEDANLACLMVFFAPFLLFNYSPGRVDHHGAQAIIAGFGLLGLARIVQNEQGLLFAILTAITFSCGFWIGAEAVPWVVVFVFCLGLFATVQGGAVARQAALFGIFLPFFTAAFIPLALPRTDYSSRALSWFSPAYVIFAALGGGVLILTWATTCTTNKKFLRLLVYVLSGISATLVFFTLVPSALSGPFTDYDTFNATTGLDNITEAQPLVHIFHFNRYTLYRLAPLFVTFTRIILLPLVAFIVCMSGAKRTRGAVRLLWIAQSVFLLCALCLTLFWQLRVSIFMELFAISPLTKLLCAWWSELKWGLWGRPLFWAESGVFLILGFFPVVLVPSLVSRASLYPDVLLFPAARSAPLCPLEQVLPILNDPESLGKSPLTLMNTSDTGPQLLFSTAHNVIAGNFNVAGNADAYQFFHTPDDALAFVIARKWHANLVLVCKTAPLLYLGNDYYAAPHIQLKKEDDGLLHLSNTNIAQPLIERLIRGQIPPWLKPIEIPDHSDYLVFQILYSAGKK